MTTERDYVLGTHDEELARLGLQHRVWRPVVLDCWQRAGITVGKRVLDIGAGPGYAAVDLAEIVGPTGEVVAIERSKNFIRAMNEACRARSLTNVRIHELDLMADELPEGRLRFFVVPMGRLVRQRSRAIDQKTRRRDGQKAASLFSMNTAITRRGIFSRAWRIRNGFGNT